MTDSIEDAAVEQVVAASVAGSAAALVVPTLLTTARTYPL